MKKNKSVRQWVYQPEAPKFGPDEKSEIIGKMKMAMGKMSKLSHKVMRIEMRGNRIYLYEQIEIENNHGAIITKELIGGKYLECAYARISIKDQLCKECSLEWQRYNDRWMTMYEGGLQECVEYIEKDDGWY